MGLFDRKPQPAPDADVSRETPAPETPAVDDRIDRLTNAVATLAENQLRVAQPQVAPQQAMSLPAIQDISDAELDRIYDEGDQRAIRAAEDVRRNAATERLRREMGGQLQQGLGQLNAITKRAILRDDPYYSADPAYRRDLDALISQVEQGGQMLTQDALEFIQQKVTGAHHTRLVKEQVEAEVRKARETPPTQRGSNPNARGLPPDLAENYGLNDDAMNALRHLNRGRGRTPDEFAAELPARKISVTDTINGRPVTRIETRRYENFGDTLRARQWAETEFERQRAIISGEISPNTPVTARN